MGQKTHWETIVTVVLALIGFAFSAGVIDTRLSALESKVEQIRIDVREMQVDEMTRCAAIEKMHTAQKRTQKNAPTD